jgi:hypothetical protein
LSPRTPLREKPDRMPAAAGILSFFMAGVSCVGAIGQPTKFRCMVKPNGRGAQGNRVNKQKDNAKAPRRPRTAKTSCLRSNRGTLSVAISYSNRHYVIHLTSWRSFFASSRLGVARLVIQPIALRRCNDAARRMAPPLIPKRTPRRRPGRLAWSPSATHEQCCPVRRSWSRRPGVRLVAVCGGSP